MPTKCLTCKSSNDIPTEEISHWSKKKGNYTPYPKMITCDEKYSLKDRDEMVEEKPEIKDGVKLTLKLGEENGEKWVFYFASNSQENPLKIESPEKAYGEDENHGLKKTNKDGKVEIEFNCPQPYKVDGKTYSRHVHYIIEEDKIWSKMYTKRIICDIDLEDLDKIIKDKSAIIINALDFEYYDKDKIPTSINLPTKRLEKLTKSKKEEIIIEFLKENITKYKKISDKVNSNFLSIKDVPIIVYCANSKCNASEKLLDHLYECDINNVLEYSGGIDEWLKERTFFKDDENDNDEEMNNSSESDDDDVVTDDDDDNDDNDDDDKDETIEVKYDGVDYIYDKSSKELCDDDAEIIAKAEYKNGELEVIKWIKNGEKKHRDNPDYKLSKDDLHDEEDLNPDDKEEEEPEEELEEEDEPDPSDPNEDDKEEFKKLDKEDEDKINFEYSYEILQSKTKNELRKLVSKLNKRKKKSYKFPIGKKGYKTKKDLIDLIFTCQGKPKSKDSDYYYYTEDELYEFKKNELITHIDTMVERDPDTYQYVLDSYDKDKLINLILNCQGKINKNKKGGGCKYRGSGWGFMF
jgi:rhodanese-related sulfurtransferase